jgi:Ca2+-binding RTX toxin-like protein
MRPLIAALLAAAAFPAAAPAATVEVVVADSCGDDVACSKYGGGTPVPVTFLQGRPGEANRVSVSREGEELVFRDAGAPLEAKAPCRSVDASTARCPVTLGQPGIRGLSLSLGDGDDEATIAGDPVVETVIRGDEGADSVTGGGENDRIDGGPGADRLNGGEGFDDVTYASARAFATVDLAAGTGVVNGETDVLSGFETLVGSPRPDVLRGGSGDELIDGGNGSDRLFGRGGDDTLFGSLGEDRLTGGPGEDRLFGDPAQGDDYYTPRVKLSSDRLDGGRGDDILADTGGRNVFLGGPGDDVLEGGAGPDRVRAGAGADLVDTLGGGRDTVDCGSGRDRADTDRRRDARRGCERGRGGGPARAAAIRRSHP